MNLQFSLKRIVATAAIFVRLPTCVAQEGTNGWPSIVPLQESISFADASKSAVTIRIVSPEGKPLYLLECHNGEYEDPDFVYSGDFHCRLTSTYSQDYYTTLLTENPNQTADWNNRGRVLARELLGNCGDYPEYGRVRHFRLRGMRITFTFSELIFKLSKDANFPDLKELQSFRFTVRVERDVAASSEIAEPVPFAYPPDAHPEDPRDPSLNCDVIVEIEPKVKGRVPIYDPTLLTTYTLEELLLFLIPESRAIQSRHGVDPSHREDVRKELVRRKPVEKLVAEFNDPRENDLYRLEIVRVLYEMDDPLIRKAFEEYRPEDTDEIAYYRVNYLARLGDGQALKALNDNYGQYHVSSLQWASSVEQFSRFQYRPAIPNIIESLKHSSLDVAVAAYQSLRKFYPGRHPELRSFEEAYKYFRELYAKEIKK
ncbi:hypothetical protein MYX65_05745 [Acidobacteria bacterium AH-259-L09]|nr:hypothetical protein [Acidobacteria bacterium AH-259-L09]